MESNNQSGTKKPPSESDLFDDVRNEDQEGASRENMGDGVEGRFGLGESLKKLISVGLGAAFMTEEHIRSYVSELKLPRDVLNSLLQGATKSKDELMQRVGNELAKTISRMDLVKEASRFAQEHKFKIQAEIEVVKKKTPSEENES